jgi:murein DD-endopeptidase MepM/ murein hydrolase activator NlpD
VIDTNARDPKPLLKPWQTAPAKPGEQHTKQTHSANLPSTIFPPQIHSGDQHTTAPEHQAATQHTDRTTRVSSNQFAPAPQPTSPSDLHAAGISDINAIKQKKNLQLRALTPAELNKLVTDIGKVMKRDGIYDNKELLIPGDKDVPFRTDATGTGNESNLLTGADITYLLAQAAQQMHERHGDTLGSDLAGISGENFADLFELGLTEQLSDPNLLSEETITGEQRWYRINQLQEKLAASSQKILHAQVANASEISSDNLDQAVASADHDQPSDDELDVIVNGMTASESDQSSDGNGGATADAAQVTEPTITEPSAEEVTTEEPPADPSIVLAEESPQEPPQDTPETPFVPELDIAVAPTPNISPTIAVQSSAQITTSSTGTLQQSSTSSSTDISSGSTQEALVDRVHLVDSFVQTLAHEYVGQFLAGDTVPPHLKQELQKAIESHLGSSFSATELDRLTLRPDLQKELLRRLDTQLGAQSSFGEATQSYLAEYLAGNEQRLPGVMRQRLQDRLVNGGKNGLSAQHNPIDSFVQESQLIVGEANQGLLLAANLRAIEPALEALIIASGEEAAFKLFSGATPEQAISLLNIPDGFNLTPEQLDGLKYSAAQTIPQISARLRLDANSSKITSGYLSPKVEKKKAQGAGTTPPTTPSKSDEEEVDALAELAGKTKVGKALSSTRAGTQRKLDRLEKLMGATWNGLTPEQQQEILRQNDFVLPKDFDPRDRIPISAAIAGIFINYTPKRLQELSDSLARSKQITSVVEQEKLTNSLTDLQVAGVARQEALEGMVVGEFLSTETAEDLSSEQRFALQREIEDQTFAQSGSEDFGGQSLPSTFTSDAPGGFSDTDFSALDMLGASRRLEDPSVYQQHLSQMSSGGGFSGRLTQAYGRGVNGFKSFRAGAKRIKNIRKTAKNIKSLGKIAANAAAQNWGGAALEALKMLRDPEVRKKVLMAGGAAAALTALPFMPAIGAAIKAAHLASQAANALGLGGGSTGAGGALGNAVGNAASSMGGGGSSAAAANNVLANSAPTSASSQIGVGGALPTPIAAGNTVGLTGFGIFSSFSGMALSSSFGAIVFFTFMVLLVINAAFLIPTPSLLPGTDPYDVTTESKYAFLRKTSSPKQLPNDAYKQVGYTIEFGPKPGYVLEITGLTDLYSFLGEGDISYLDGTNPDAHAVTGELDPTAPDGVNPDTAAAKKITSPLTLETFGTEKIESAVTKRYQQVLRATDTLVLNTVKITYNVYDEAGTLLRSGEVIANSAGVRIGNPKTACWPASGAITLGPRSGTRTHQYAEAFDIGAAAGTRIYTPYAGTACNNVYPYIPGVGYGYNVVVSFNYNGLDLKLVFAHMLERTDFGGSACKEVSEGEFIGLMGTTGNSTGEHLHYELRVEGRPDGMSIRDLIFDGATAQVGNQVKTCYE